MTQCLPPANGWQSNVRYGLYTAITLTISTDLFKYSIQSAYGKQHITINLSAIIQKTFKPPDSGRFIIIKPDCAYSQTPRQNPYRSFIFNPLRDYHGVFRAQ